MVSVIIPTYNNEDTIQRALTSVVCQTEYDWQIVIVNDASTDNTLKIIHDNFEIYYGKKMKVITNKENVGVGISRKIGVDNADGEFVIFLDSDDYLVPNCLEVSLMLQKQHDSDVVYTNTTIYLDSEHVKNLDVPDLVMEGKISPSLHLNCIKKWLTGKMFRTELMKKVPMSPKRIGEDVTTLFYACYMANKVRSSSYSGYIHLYREGSLIGLGTDRPFYYYCLSTECDIEMMSFIEDDGNQDVFDKMFLIPNLNYIKHKEDIASGKIKTEEVEECQEMWDRICKWFDSKQKNVEQ